MPNLSYSNSLVDMRVILGVFRHAESKSSLYLVLSLFLKKVLVILLEPLTVVSGFWSTVRFCRSKPFLQTIGNAIDFRVFWKKSIENNKQWFWDQNRKIPLLWNNLLASLSLAFLYFVLYDQSSLGFEPEISNYPRLHTSFHKQPYMCYFCVLVNILLFIGQKVWKHSRVVCSLFRAPL